MPTPLIAVTESSEESTLPYVAAIEGAGGRSATLNVNAPLNLQAALSGVQGLILTGGADIHPSWYGEQIDPTAGVQPHGMRDLVELPLARAALERDMPVLGICRGMHVLNVLLGGRLVQDLAGHRPALDKGPLAHDIFVTPGCRLTAILGVGGFMKVNSHHHQGLRWAHKAPNLVVSAYSLLKDGIIEAIESPNHFWLIGVQFRPERPTEVPAVFRHLFASLVKAAATREGVLPTEL